MMSDYTRMGEQEINIQRLTDEFIDLGLNEDDAYQEYKDTGDGTRLMEKLITIKDRRNKLKERFVELFRGSSEFTELIISPLEMMYKEQDLKLVADVREFASRIKGLRSLEHVLNKVYEEGVINQEQYLLRKEELKRRELQQCKISKEIVDILSADYNHESVLKNS
jgi:hypothetical protein